MSKAFGQRLLNLLQKQGITQKELADRINTTEATLSRYVSGDREPKADMLANIATALHTTSDYLLGIESDDFDFPKVERLLARNSATMSEKQKRALISALFGEDSYWHLDYLISVVRKLRRMWSTLSRNLTSDVFR